MLKNFSILLLCGLSLFSCQEQPKGNVFGADVSPDGAMSYDELVVKMADQESMPAKVTAKVDEVCQMSGCWLSLASEKADVPSMRVTFKDYGFKVPKDLSGKKVVIEGLAYIETTSVDDQRHYAEDAGKTKEEIEAITEPLKELTFEATGVRILN